MKTVKFVFTAVLAVLLGQGVYSQMHDHANMTSSKTGSIKVYGNCESCQARIEKAAKLNGVSKASWNKDTKILTLTYDPSKVTSDDVQKKIATVGHDTEKFKADDKAYAKLPGCCQYERKTTN